MKNKRTQAKKVTLKGYMLIESLVSITVFAILAGIFSSNFVTVNQSSLQNKHRFQANEILTESVEAIRSIRDQNFLYLTNGEHGLQYLDNTWSFNGTENLIEDIFTRRITINSIKRNLNGDIDSEGSISDERTKSILIEVSWISAVEGEQKLSTDYIITDSFAFDKITTLESEWGQGSFQQTRVIGSPEGTLVLDTYESWDNSIHDSTEEYSSNHVKKARGIDVIDTIAYLSSDDDSNKPDFRTIDISNPLDVNELDSIDTGETSYDVAVKGDIAYLASKKNQELVMINISNPRNIFLEGKLNISGSLEAKSIDISGNRLYLGLKKKGGSKELLIYDIQNPTNPNLLGELETNAHIYDIEVSGDTAYLAVENGKFGGGGGQKYSLIIVDISNAEDIQLLSQIAVTDNKKGRALAIKNSTLYFGSKKSESDQEFKIYDVSDPRDPIEKGTLEINENISDIDVYEDYAFITTEKKNKAFQVIDIKNSNSPSIVTTFDLEGDGNKIVANENAIYVASEYNRSPIYIFTYPETPYYTTGDYISESFDSGSINTAWNGIYWDGTLESSTTVDFQIRTADTQSHLSSADWVGPDGTNSTTFTNERNIITIAPSSSGTRWYQYKITLEGDGNYTPEINSTRTQYSP